MRESASRARAALECETRQELFRIDGKKPAESRWAFGNQCKVLSGGGFMGYNCGGLVSTLNDQVDGGIRYTGGIIVNGLGLKAKFYRMLTNGGCVLGGNRLLSAACVQDMLHHDWLRMPQIMGKPQKNSSCTGVTAPAWFGWNALGTDGELSCQQPIPCGDESSGWLSLLEVKLALWTVRTSMC
eukprot:3579230-Amphidinium_carterae.1